MRLEQLFDKPRTFIDWFDYQNNTKSPLSYNNSIFGLPRKDGQNLDTLDMIEMVHNFLSKSFTKDMVIRSGDNWQPVFLGEWELKKENEDILVFKNNVIAFNGTESLDDLIRDYPDVLQFNPNYEI